MRARREKEKKRGREEEKERSGGEGREGREERLSLLSFGAMVRVVVRFRGGRRLDADSSTLEYTMDTNKLRSLVIFFL